MMSRKTLDKMMKYLHLADNRSLDQNDKFSKEQPLLNSEQYLFNYLPEQAVSIDKPMVSYFGIHRCKQFMNSMHEK